MKKTIHKINHCIHEERDNLTTEAYEMLTALVIGLVKGPSNPFEGLNHGEKEDLLKLERLLRKTSARVIMDPCPSAEECEVKSCPHRYTHLYRLTCMDECAIMGCICKAAEVKENDQ